ncbi:MAG TPA: serine/threonine-protein kinase, partial [Labilithrix sp.]
FRSIKVSVDQRRWESLERLSREAQFVASLQHPNICDIFDFGWLPTYGPYIVTERLFGESLAVRRHRRRMLTLTETIEITNQILCGLHAAHGRQIIHRDLKPRNVFLVDRINCAPLVKILDFGLARDLTMSDSRRLTRPGQALGTYGYMSPEQLKGESPTVRSDLFAVGIMAYEMLAGVHPFAGESQADMAASIMHDPTPPLGRGGREGPKLEQVLGRALAKEPLSRFPDAVAFQRALLELHAQSYVDDSEPLSDTGSG